MSVCRTKFAPHVLKKRYNLNNRCKKNCLNYLPEDIKTHGMKLDYFLDEKVDSALIFLFQK